MTDSSNRIVLLGTGAGITPKPGRQSAAAALRCEGETYLVDCGNGVGPQMVRAGIPLGSLRAIFITHHHLDHVADFGVVIAQCWLQLARPVALVGPPPLARMFRQFQELYGLDLNDRVADEGRQPLHELVQVIELAGEGPCYENEHVKVSAARVPHGSIADAYAYRFESRGISVVFSGDTAFTERLASFATGAQTLLHEATFPSALAAAFPAQKAERLLARLARAHSTVTEAARVAHRSGVGRLVLTPLSPTTGVEDAEWISAARAEFSGEVIVGRDLLEVPL